MTRLSSFAPACAGRRYMLCPCHHGYHYPPPHDQDHHLTPQVLGKGGSGHHDGLACHSQQGDRCHESSNCGQFATFVVFRHSSISLEIKSDKRMNKIRKVIDETNIDDLHLLHHPGKIHYFHRKKVEEKMEYFISEQQSFSFSNDIIILDQMVFDHTQPYYEEAFEKCNIIE